MAARALANTGGREALGSLIKLLGSDDAKVRSRSAAALRHLTGQQFGYTPYEDPAKRAVAVKNWSEWVAKNGDAVELIIPIPDHEPMLGRTLISYYSRNLVVELDENLLGDGVSKAFLKALVALIGNKTIINPFSIRRKNVVCFSPNTFGCIIL